ncbi:MAG: glycosyltransferase [Bacteroidota bacterium]
MKILYISSGNSGAVNIIVKNQAESLKNLGAEVSSYLIRGRGIRGYLKHIFLLRKYLRNNKFDLYHAHYSFSGFTAAMAGCRPLVVSLMGSDTYSAGLFRLLIRFFSHRIWRQTIVKSEGMREALGLDAAIILPNGVDTGVFHPADRTAARKELGLPENQKIILFIADPSRPEKNFQLARTSLDRLNDQNTILLPVYNTSHTMIPLYMNAGNVLLLTSLWEGSTNVVKEAMACELPVVSTDVGDIKRNIGKLKGCFIAEPDPEQIAAGLSQALAFSGETGGRERLSELGLDAPSVAGKLMDIYTKMIDN